MSEIGIATSGMRTERQRAEEKEDDDADDEQRLDQRVENFVDRGVDVFGGVVGDAALHAGRQFLLDVVPSPSGRA